MSGSVRTALELLHLTTDYFSKKGIGTARLDAELLLSTILETDRVGLYCRFDQIMEPGEIARFRELVRRRAALEPVAYIIGKKEFFGLDFKVCPGVLIPRPDTETLVEKAIDHCKSRPECEVLDIGIGSGAIAIALAANESTCHITGTDVSETCIEVASENAVAHGLTERVKFVPGDLFGQLSGPFDLILSNPPYVPLCDKESLSKGIVDYEPHEALFAGENGLDVYKRLIPDCLSHLSGDGAVMVEIGKGQEKDVMNLFDNTGVFDKIETVKDLAGIERVVCAYKKAGELHG